MTNKIPPVKKLTALALTQPKETLIEGYYNHILFIDRKFDVINRWMEAYDLYNIANEKQLN